METLSAVFGVLFSLHSLDLGHAAPFIGSMCTFEDARICEFEQDGADTFSWTQLSGPTPNSQTGPDVDHTYRTATGHFMYADGSGQQSGDIARLRSGYHVNINNSPICVQFWTHMFGNQMGTLTVYLEDATGGGPGRQVDIFNKAGNHGNNWQLTMIQVQTTPSMFRVVFEATVRGSGESDMAIDDFSITEGTICLAAQNTMTPYVVTGPPLTSSLNTAPPLTTKTSSGTITSLSTDAKTQTSSGIGGVTTETSTNVVSTSGTTLHVSTITDVTCDFEQDLCGWIQETTDSGDWQIVHGINRNRQPVRYLRVMAPPIPTPGHRYRLRSSTFSAHNQSRCLAIGYMLIGQNVGRLVVSYGSDQDDLPIWLDRQSRTGAWTEARIYMSSLTGRTATWLVIEAVMGTGDTGEIRLNTTKLTDGPCV